MKINFGKWPIGYRIALTILIAGIFLKVAMYV